MNVVIAGLGLIGGSLGMALRRRGWHVAYVDPAVPLHAAREAADERLNELRGDFVVLAAPLDASIGMLRRLAGSDALVTSTCSVMLPLRAAGRELRFIAGHPFAGSERSGIAAARADLFERRPWFIESHDPMVDRLVRDAGAEPVVIDAARHDEILAVTSHLPQVIATALASLIEQQKIDPLFFGSGLKSMLRLAGSSHDVWKPVLESNRANVSAAIDALHRVIEGLSDDDFDRARDLYRKISE